MSLITISVTALPRMDVYPTTVDVKNRMSNRVTLNNSLLDVSAI